MPKPEKTPDMMEQIIMRVEAIVAQTDVPPCSPQETVKMLLHSIYLQAGIDMIRAMHAPELNFVVTNLYHELYQYWRTHETESLTDDDADEEASGNGH